MLPCSKLRCTLHSTDDDDDDDAAGTFYTNSQSSSSEDETTDIYEPPRQDAAKGNTDTDGTGSLVEDSDAEMLEVDNDFHFRVSRNINNNNINAANHQPLPGIHLDEDANEIIVKEDGSEDDANDDTDENFEEMMNRDHAQVLSQRQSTWDKNVFMLRSTHQLTLTEEGFKVLQSTPEGKIALDKIRAEHNISSTSSKRKSAPQRCKSNDIVQLLLDSPKRNSLHPIVAHNDEIRLKFCMTVTFPGSRRNTRTIGPRELHDSDQKNVIVRFFYEVWPKKGQSDGHNLDLD